MRFLEFLLILAMIGVVGFLGYGYVGERAALDRLTESAAKARAADISSASTRQVSCTADVTSALKAGVAIARIATPRARTVGAPQPLVTGQEIQEAIQQ